MKIICPRCQKENTHSAEVAGIIKCDHCGEWVTPHPVADSDEEKSWQVTIKPDPHAAEAEQNLTQRRAVIRAKADKSGMFAALFTVVGVIAAIASIMANLGGNSAVTGWLLVSGAFGFALWFWLLEQIIHIRANTEK